MEGQIWYYLYIPVFMIGVIVGSITVTMVREKKETKSQKNKPTDWKWPGA